MTAREPSVIRSTRSKVLSPISQGSQSPAVKQQTNLSPYPKAKLLSYLCCPTAIYLNLNYLICSCPPPLSPALRVHPRLTKDFDFRSALVTKHNSGCTLSVTSDALERVRRCHYFLRCSKQNVCSMCSQVVHDQGSLVPNQTPQSSRPTTQKSETILGD